MKTTDIISECSFKPDMIKLDIEGSEYEVVLGGIGVLRELRPLLQIELHKDNMPPGGSAPDCQSSNRSGLFTRLCNEAVVKGTKRYKSRLFRSRIP